MWSDPNMLDRYIPHAFVRRKHETELSIQFKNRSLLSLHGSEDPDRLRGMDFAGVVIDEWALCKPEIWFEILRPIITQNERRWAMFIFTPKGLNHAHDLWVKTAGNNDWLRSFLPVSVSGLLPVNEVEKARDEIPSNLYAQEFECSFLAASSNLVISPADVLKCVKLDTPSGLLTKKRITVADIGAEGNDETVIYDMEGPRVMDQEIFRHNDLMDTTGRIIAHTVKFKSQAVAVDKIGEGDGVFSRLREVLGSDLQVIGFDSRVKAKNEVTFGNRRAEMFWNAGKKFKRLMACVPEDATLIKQLSNLTYHYTSAGKILVDKTEDLRKAMGSSPDRAVTYAMGLEVLDMVEEPKADDKYTHKNDPMYSFNPATV